MNMKKKEAIKISKEDINNAIKDKELHKFGLSEYMLDNLAIALAIVKKVDPQRYEMVSFFDKKHSLELLPIGGIYFLKREIEYDGPFTRGMIRIKVDLKNGTYELPSLDEKMIIQKKKKKIEKIKKKVMKK